MNCQQNMTGLPAARAWGGCIDHRTSQGFPHSTGLLHRLDQKIFVETESSLHISSEISIRHNA